MRSGRSSPTISASAGEAEHAAVLGDDRLLEPELLAQHRLGGGIELLVELEHDHPPAPAPLDRGAEEADEVLGLFLDLDVAVAQHAEHAVAVDAEAGEQQPGEAADELLDGDEGRLLAGDAHEARDRARDQHHLEQPAVVAEPGQVEQRADALVGDERERMRGIDRLRRDHRQDVVEEVSLQPALGRGVDPLVSGEMDALGGEQAAQVRQDPLLRILELAHLGVDRGELLRRRLAVDRDVADAAAHLPGEPGDADHHELVEVAARDRQEAQPLEQRVGGVGRLRRARAR